MDASQNKSVEISRRLGDDYLIVSSRNGSQTMSVSKSGPINLFVWFRVVVLCLPFRHVIEFLLSRSH